MAESESNVSEGTRAWNPSKAELAISSLSGVLFVVEIVVCFFFFYNYYSIDILLYSGWLLLILGLIMMSIPRYELLKNGNIPEGKSWINTTMVIDSGIYGILRHPLYVGWLIDVIAMMVISQYWITILFGIVPFIVIVYYVYDEDRLNVKKFGQSYIEYQQKVPMMNFILGVIRYRHRRFEGASTD